jgi:hypothetical protein
MPGSSRIEQQIKDIQDKSEKVKMDVWSSKSHTTILIG